MRIILNKILRDKDARGMKNGMRKEGKDVFVLI